MVKKAGSCVYSHRSNIKELNENLMRSKDKTYWAQKWEVIVKFLKLHETCNIIKVDKTNRSITLIESPDFDTAFEPIVGRSIRLDLHTGKISTQKNGNKVYHSKEMFVADKYTGFDIAKAKERTILWNSIPGIRTEKNKIGNLNYWIEFCKRNGLEVSSGQSRTEEI